MRLFSNTMLLIMLVAILSDDMIGALKPPDISTEHTTLLATQAATSGTEAELIHHQQRHIDGDLEREELLGGHSSSGLPPRVRAAQEHADVLKTKAAQEARELHRFPYNGPREIREEQRRRHKKRAFKKAFIKEMEKAEERIAKRKRHAKKQQTPQQQRRHGDEEQAAPRPKIPYSQRVAIAAAEESEEYDD